VRILTVYAHPDDESFGPASVLAHYVRQGAELHGVWFTRGEHGQPTPDTQPSPDELAALRERDLRQVAKLIGYQSLEIEHFEDGTLAQMPRGLLETRVLTRLRNVQPDVVLTFGPGGITRHPDHVAVHRATLAAFHRAREEGIPVRELYYDAVAPEAAQRLGVTDEPDGRPNTRIDVADSQDVKRQALAVHARHVADAATRLERLEREPLPVETLYRAWPAVHDDEPIRSLMSSATAPRPRRDCAPGTSAEWPGPCRRDPSMR
jgi:N-acetylglucosamine malate deacetylase 2